MFSPSVHGLSHVKFLAHVSVPDIGLTCATGLKSKWKVVGYSHDICATIASWPHFIRPVVVVAFKVHNWVRLMITFVF